MARAKRGRAEKWVMSRGCARQNSVLRCAAGRHQMPEFVIEKEVSGLGQLSPFQQDLTIRRSCSTLHGISPDVERLQSYLTENKANCGLPAPSEPVRRDLIDQSDLRA